MKIIANYFKVIANSLLESSKVANNLNHAVSIGTVREILIQNFLQKVLPQYITFCSGQIFDYHEHFSGQIDIIATPITSPRLHISDNISIFPAESVLSAIEVKSVLNTGLSQCIDNCLTIKMLSNCSGITDPKEYDFKKKCKSNISYSIFGFDGIKLNTLIKNIECYCKTHNTSYHNPPDAIIVLKKGYIAKKYDISTHHSHNDFISFNTSYKTFNDPNIVLFEYFKYFIELINKTFTDPLSIPIDKYENEYKRQINFSDFI